MTDAPIINLMPLGNLANRMIQLMVGLRIASEVPGAVLSNVSLPEWAIDHAPLVAPDHRALRVEGQKLDLPLLVRKLRSGQIERLDIAAYGQRMDQFLPAEAYRSLFKADHLHIQGGDERTLVINIRGGEILDGQHRDYVLLPVEFYRQVVRDSGLRPLFMGQIEDNPYIAALKDAFPEAEFRPSAGLLNDFEFLRRSRHVVVSVSTFSWLATWLSHAETIVLPLSGMLNPFQQHDADFVPPDDPRYTFYLFPINIAVPVAQVAQAHAAMHGAWRKITAAEVASLRARAPLFRVSRADLQHVFDEAFYLALHPDVRAVVEAGGFTGALEHYVRWGFFEGRPAFAFDAAFYSRTYLDAAVSVGQGDYLDLLHHYIAAGRQAGYAPVAPDPG